MSPAYFFVDDFLKNHLDYALGKTGKQVHTFFDTFTAVLKATEVSKSLELIIPVKDLILRLSHLILNTSGERDQHLIGLFKVLKTILDQFPQEREAFQGKQELLKFLAHRVLVSHCHPGLGWAEEYFEHST